MNARQARELERVRTTLLENFARGAIRAVEFKKWEVTDSDCGLVFVVSEIGHVDDEHSLLSVFSRDYRHLTIGKRGGLQLLSSKNRRRVTGRAALYALSR